MAQPRRLAINRDACRQLLAPTRVAQPRGLNLRSHRLLPSLDFSGDAGLHDLVCAELAAQDGPLHRRQVPLLREVPREKEVLDGSLLRGPAGLEVGEVLYTDCGVRTILNFSSLAREPSAMISSSEFFSHFSAGAKTSSSMLLSSL